jgi:glutamine amidotransferase
MARVAVLDYGMGNLRSVEKALERVGSQATITADGDIAREADGVVLPGVGAFPAAMRRVRELGLDDLVPSLLGDGKPVLGICLGVQLLFDRSNELGGAEGLGLISGPVTELDAPGLKVPHMGWEPVRWERDSQLTEGIDTETPFYFVHSFVVRPEAGDDVVGTAEWGERFACVIARPPLYGVQFHPEKSSAAGLRLLANFAEICSEREAHQWRKKLGRTRS